MAGELLDALVELITDFVARRAGAWGALRSPPRFGATTRLSADRRTAAVVATGGSRSCATVVERDHRSARRSGGGGKTTSCLLRCTPSDRQQTVPELPLESRMP